MKRTLQRQAGGKLEQPSFPQPPRQQGDGIVRGAKPSIVRWKTRRHEAKEARAAVAAEQAKAAESEREKADLFRQIADLQRVLGDEKTRASKLEAKLEMMETQVIPQTAEEMRAKLKRKGDTQRGQHGQVRRRSCLPTGEGRCSIAEISVGYFILAPCLKLMTWTVRFSSSTR
jgi:hypothetical protein